MHKIRRTIVSMMLAWFLAGAASAYGQTVSFQASVDSTTVELGSSIQLTLAVEGTQNVSPVQLPPIDGFDVRYLGPSTQVSIINGRSFTSASFVYNLYPLQVGNFQIPALTMNIQGQDYSTRPIDITVVDAGDTISRGRQGSEPTTLRDKIFIVMGTPKDEVYLNEKVPLTVKFLINGIGIKDFNYPEFDHVGFTVDAFPKPLHHQQLIGGIKYDVVEFTTFIYPTRTGDLTLGPAELTANVLFKRPGRGGSPFDSFGSIFDDELFRGVFNSYDVRSITLESEPLPIHVLPWPEDNKPKDFSGAVGQFDFDLTVSPSAVKVGDPLTVRMKVTGDGNMKGFAMPSFPEQDKFKFYEPSVTEENGVKTLEQVVIPNAVTAKTLPAVTFSYFDPVERKYKSITKGPFPLTVTPLGQGEEMRVVGLKASPSTAGGRKEETFGKDIIFIKEHPGRFQTVGARLYQNPVFLALTALIFLLWGGLTVAYHVTHRIRTDAEFARRLLAPRQARQGLAKARDALQHNQQDVFYETLFKTVKQYLGHKLHIPAAQVTYFVVQEKMSTRIPDEKFFGKLKDLFEHCEMVSYASAVSDPSQMETVFHYAEEIIDHLERTWK